MSDELVAWLRGVLDDVDSEAADVHVLDCELTMTAGFHGPCTCGWPDRLTAGVEAKRRIIDEHAATDGAGGPACDRCSADEEGQHGMGWWVPSPCRTLRLLAESYAGRPGWREEWRPA